MPNSKTFDRYEIAKVEEIDGACNPLMGREPETGAKVFWTLYGHIDGEGVMAISIAKPANRRLRFIA